MNSGEFGFSRNCSERDKGEAETIIKVRRCWIINALYKNVRSKCTWIVLQDTQNGRTYPWGKGSTLVHMYGVRCQEKTARITFTLQLNGAPYVPFHKHPLIYTLNFN